MSVQCVCGGGGGGGGGCRVRKEVASHTYLWLHVSTPRELDKCGIISLDMGMLLPVAPPPSSFRLTFIFAKRVITDSIHFIF